MKGFTSLKRRAERTAVKALVAGGEEDTRWRGCVTKTETVFR